MVSLDARDQGDGSRSPSPSSRSNALSPFSSPVPMPQQQLHLSAAASSDATRKPLQSSLGRSLASSNSRLRSSAELTGGVHKDASSGKGEGGGSGGGSDDEFGVSVPAPSVPSRRPSGSSISQPSAGAKMPVTQVTLPRRSLSSASSLMGGRSYTAHAPPHDDFFGGLDIAQAFGVGGLEDSYSSSYSSIPGNVLPPGSAPSGAKSTPQTQLTSKSSSGGATSKILSYGKLGLGGIGLGQSGSKASELEVPFP